MIKPLLCILFCLFLGQTLAQDYEMITNKGIIFEIEDSEDLINFIVADTVLLERKPLLLFCQGSHPVPLLIEEANGEYLYGCGLGNFNLEEAKREFHIVVLSMPSVPPVIPISSLDEKFNYVDSKGQVTNEFIKGNYLENYAKRGNKVIHYLLAKQWINPVKIAVLGHSQGAKVALKIAESNLRITHLGLLGLNPFGRIDESIRKIRREASNGKISWDAAEKQIQNQYDFYEVIQDEKVVEENPAYLAWQSFSRPLLSDLLKIEIPIFLGYGTEDITSELCDLVPLFFIQNGKTNLLNKRYHNLEHNFFELKPNGKPDYENGHWSDVVQDFINFTHH